MAWPKPHRERAVSIFLEHDNFFFNVHTVSSKTTGTILSLLLAYRFAKEMARTLSASSRFSLSVCSPTSRCSEGRQLRRDVGRFRTSRRVKMANLETSENGHVHGQFFFYPLSPCVCLMDAHGCALTCRHLHSNFIFLNYCAPSSDVNMAHLNFTATM